MLKTGPEEGKQQWGMDSDCCPLFSICEMSQSHSWFSFSTYETAGGIQWHKGSMSGTWQKLKRDGSYNGLWHYWALTHRTDFDPEGQFNSMTTWNLWYFILLIITDNLTTGSVKQYAHTHMHICGMHALPCMQWDVPHPFCMWRKKVVLLLDSSTYIYKFLKRYEIILFSIC